MGFTASTCPYCACGCGVLIEEAEGALVAPYPIADHPISRGTLCIRGWNAVDAWHHPDRLLSPLVRTGTELVKATSDEAVKRVCERLCGCIHSPESACFVLAPSLSNEDLLATRALARDLGASLVGADFSGVPTAHRAMSTVFGTRLPSASLDVVDSANLIWLVGARLEDCPQVGARVLEAESRGARIVSFDIYQSAERRAWERVFVQPSRFPVLPLLLQKSALEIESCRSLVDSLPGFEALRAQYRDVSWMPDLHGLDQQRISELVREMAAHRSSAIIVGERWLTTGRAAEQTVELLQALALLGKTDRLLFASGESNSWGLSALVDDQPGAAWTAADLLKGEMPGLSVLFLCGGDLLDQVSCPDLLNRLYSSVNAVIVLDRFAGGALRFADVVLPLCGFAESDASVTSGFGTFGRWSKAVDPPGQAVSLAEWMKTIAREMGFDVPPAGTSASLPAPFAGIRGLLASERGWCLCSPEQAGPVFKPAQPIILEPSTDGYPVELLFARHPASGSSGSITSRDEILSRESIHPGLFVTPEKLKEIGIKPGSRARVETPYGSQTFVAREDSRLSDRVALIEAPARSQATLSALAPARTVSLSFLPLPCRIVKA